MRFRFWVLMMMAAAMLSSCKVKERVVTVIEHRTDTLQITKQQRDSIWMHDSVYVTEKQRGDTVWIEVARWNTRYVTRETHDTLYQATHDSVPVPYTVPEYVEKQLTWWQRTKMAAGGVFMWLIVIVGLAWIVKKKTG